MGQAEYEKTLEYKVSKVEAELDERVAELEVQVAELAVCCKSCTNRLDKLEN